MGAGTWITEARGRLRRFAARLAEARRGNVAMIFALALPALILMTLGGVDIHRASTVRVNLQDALDAAALAAARSNYTSTADLTTVGLAALKANLQAYPDITLREDQTTFVLNSDQVVVASSVVDVKTIVANIFLPPYGKFMDDKLPVGAHSEVNRSSKNLEVALVLDITGSMSGSRITDLKAAANELVDTVVQDLQTPYYSKMSIIPYSMGVNLGSYANTARGAPTAGRAITGASWRTGTARSVSAITQASPGVITTTANHGYATGNFVWISGVNGMTQLNNRSYRVVRVSNTRFSLQSWNGSAWAAVATRSWDGYGAYTSGGTIQPCQVSDCSVVVTASAHGLTNGDYVYITGVNGMTQINNGSSVPGYQVANVTTNTYSIGYNGASWSNYTSGGTSYCGQYGCLYRVFVNADGNLRRLDNSSCVSERTGADAYTSAYTTSARVGFNYPASNSDRNANSCPGSDSVITPLSSSRSSLHTLIDNLTIGGSTAGQIGMAWGWYSISPSFNAMWPSSSAGALNDDDIVKSVIFMTDGEFNTPYCSGVIASNAASGSGNNSDHINCAATNGDPFAQTLALCTAMKAQGIIVYTVGFSVAAGGQAANLMANCATGPDYAFLPASGADLSDAFKAIGRDITRLRISK